MPVVVTWMARVTDWQALRRLNRERLVDRARAAGATRYRLYRDLKDASRLLVIAEFPDHDAVAAIGGDGEELRRALGAAGIADDRVWEAIEADGIG